MEFSYRDRIHRIRYCNMKRRLMSQMGQRAKSRPARRMSASPPIAIKSQSRNVASVPVATLAPPLFDHLVRTGG